MSVAGVSIGSYAEPIAPGSVPTLVWLAAGNSGLFKRESGVWSEVTLPAAFFGSVSRIAAVDGLPDVLFVSDGESQAVTENGGDTWTECDPFTNNRSVHDIAIGPDADTLYVAQFSSDNPVGGDDPGRVWRSTDKGSTWSLWAAGHQAASGSYGIQIPRIAWADQGSGFYALYVTDWDQNGPDNTELHWYDINAGPPPSAFDLHADVGADANDLMLSKIRGQSTGYLDVVFLWARTFPTVPASDFGVQRWYYDNVDVITPPGYVASATPTKYWIGVQGHRLGTVLAFFHTVTGSLVDILRSHDFGSTWTHLGQFSTSSGGSDPAFRATNSATFRQNATPNPDDSTEWWALSAKADQILHSTDNGNTWSTETVTGLTAANANQIMAVPI